MQGGMWGFKMYKNRGIAKKIFNRILNRKGSFLYKRDDRKPFDQFFLSDKVYPLIRDRSLIHDSYLCNRFKDSVPFPSQREGNCFIGSPLSCNLESKSFFKCPIECRPLHGLNWTYC